MAQNCESLSQVKRECLQQGTLEIRLGPPVFLSWKRKEREREHLRAVGWLPCCQARTEDLKLRVAEDPGVKVVGSGDGQEER